MKNIEALIDDGGEITLGKLHAIDCAANRHRWPQHCGHARAP